MPDRPTVIVASADLMSAVRVVDTANAAGYLARAVDTMAALEEAAAEAGIVVIDCATPPAEPAAIVARVRALNGAARLIAVYRHTDLDQGRTARASGCDLVLNRAQFFGDIPGALTKALAPPADAPGISRD